MTAPTQVAARSTGWRLTPAAKPTTLLLFALEREPRVDIIPGFNKPDLRFASPSDLDKIHKEHSAPWAAIDPEYRQAGDRCLLQFSHDELIGLSWVTTSPLAYLSHGAYYNLPDDICYTYNPHTSVAHDAVMCRAIRDQTALSMLQSEGKRRLLTAIDEQQLSDKKELQSYGYELVGHMHLRVRRGRLRLTVDVRDDYWSFERRT